jgi:NitT/TauT family transport system substrate-binding protein
MPRRTLKATTFVIALTAGLLAAGARAEPLKIRAGWVTTPASLVPVMFAKQGLAKHLGKSYVFEPIYINASPRQITAIAAGELDIAALGFSSFPFAVANAGLTDLRIITDEIQDGGPDRWSTLYMVRKDSGIQTVADLKGKVVAVNGLGSGVHMALTAMLQKHGLQDKRDYIVIEAPFPTMKAVLAERKADLIVGGTPFAFDPELVAISRTLFTQRDAIGPSELSFWTARADFLAKHRAVMIDLLEDKLRAVRWYLDPANRQEAISLIAAFMKQPPARFEGWLFAKNDFFRNPDGIVDLDALQNNVNLMRQIGVLKADLEAAKYADLSLVKEAAQRLK